MKKSLKLTNTKKQSQKTPQWGLKSTQMKKAWSNMLLSLSLKPIMVYPIKLGKIYLVLANLGKKTKSNAIAFQHIYYLD